jgi:anti-sigma B factor antagonist
MAAMETGGDMAQSALTMDVRRAGDKVSIVDIRGDVTAASEEALTNAFNRATTPPTRAILFNFEQLEYMNSGGIGLLVTLLVRANRQRQAIMAFGLSDHYRQIFELTRLDDAIGIYDDEQGALAAAGAS